MSSRHRPASSPEASALNGTTADMVNVEASFLCADVVRFTAMTQRLGDRTSLRLMRRVAQHVEEEAARCRGTIVEVRGDSFLLALPDPRWALRCAYAIHEALRDDATRHEDEGVDVRMAIHSGRVIRVKDRFFGLNLILPYRMLSMVKAGQIAITDEAHSRVRPDPGAALHRTFRPKGFEEEVAFSVLDAAPSAAESPRSARSAIPATCEPLLLAQLGCRASQ